MKRIPCYINCYLCFKEFKVKPHRKHTAKFCNKRYMDIYIKEFGFSKERKEKMSKGKITCYDIWFFSSFKIRKTIY